VSTLLGDMGGVFVSSPAALLLVAVMGMAGLLVTFGLVAEGIRQRSIVRHQTEAEQMRSQWQCAALLRAARRDSCRLQLASAQP
jgi:phosphate/sulfate permease